MGGHLLCSMTITQMPGHMWLLTQCVVVRSGHKKDTNVLFQVLNTTQMRMKVNVWNWAMARDRRRHCKFKAHCFLYIIFSLTHLSNIHIPTYNTDLWALVHKYRVHSSVASTWSCFHHFVGYRFKNEKNPNLSWYLRLNWDSIKWNNACRSQWDVLPKIHDIKLFLKLWASLDRDLKFYISGEQRVKYMFVWGYTPMYAYIHFFAQIYAGQSQHLKATAIHLILLFN